MWIAADLGWMYYESYVHTSPPRESVFHFLVDVRSLFLAMALLLDQNEQELPYFLDVGSLLDGVQLFIIFSLIYLGWYHIFSLHENRVLSILRSDQIEVCENGAVLALAALQAMRAQTSELRKLYLEFLGCFGSLALATSYTDYRELRIEERFRRAHGLTWDGQSRSCSLRGGLMDGNNGPVFIQVMARDKAVSAWSSKIQSILPDP